MSHPLYNLGNFPFRRAKTVVKCTSAGQLTGSRTTGELLLLKNGHRQRILAGQALKPQKFSEVTSLTRLVNSSSHCINSTSLSLMHDNKCVSGPWFSCGSFPYWKRRHGLRPTGAGTRQRISLE